jgi:succinate dehydrogenase / fumarate reductase, flavoprotein subunit
LLVCREGYGDTSDSRIIVTRQSQIPMRDDLLELFEISELEKYYTNGELADHPGRTARTES